MLNLINNKIFNLNKIKIKLKHSKIKNVNMF